MMRRALLAAAILFGLACAQRGAATLEQASAPTRALSAAERAEMVSDTWGDRINMSPDSARPDGRSLYLLLDRDPAYASRFSLSVRRGLVDDTTAYELRPPRPVGLRTWAVRSIRLVSEDRAELTARVTYDSMEHTEVFTLSRIPAGGAKTWGVSEVRVHQRTWY